MNPVKRIISIFMHGEMPQNVQDRFCSWYLTPEETASKEDALYEEWEELCRKAPADPVSPAARRARLSAIHKKISTHDRTARKGIFIGWRTAAAILAAVLSITWAEYFFISENSLKETTCLVSSEDGKGYFTLPDGSRVWLNSGSRLEYDGYFGNLRSVRLSGEAYFDVVKSSAPFVVEMETMKIRVFGTAFNACSSRIFPEEQVTLSEGKVQVTCSGMDVTLLPGQQCAYNAATGKILVREVDVANYSSWKEDSITFDNMPLGEIVTNLEHWYSTRIELGPGVDTSVRLSFKLRPETVEEALTVLEHLTRYRCTETEDGRILISPQH